MTALLEPLRLDRPATPPSRPQRVRHDWLIVAGLVAAYALVQSAFVHQPALSDQMHYFLDASTLPNITEPPHQALRIGLTIPVWLLIQVFGYSEAAYYGMPYLSAVGLIVAVYWLGRLLDSRVTGALAGLLVFANPIVLDDTSQLLPDIPAAALLTGAVTLLVWQWQRTADPSTLTRWDGALLVGIGVMLGWSYLVREFIVLWFPAVVLAAWMLRLPRAWWRLMTIGAAGAFAFELLWGLVFFGNPFARIAAALNQPASEPWRVVERERLIAVGDIPNTHGELLTAMPTNLVSSDAGWVLVGLFVVLIGAALALRSPKLRMLALWVVVPMGAMLFVVEVAWLFDNRIVRPEKLRYWIPLIPPLVVGGVAALLALGRRVAGEPGRMAGIAVAGMVVVASLMLSGAHLDRQPNFTRTGQDEYLQFREWAATAGQTCNVIWTDADHWRASSRWVPMYLRGFWGRPIWDGQLKDVNAGDRWTQTEDLGTAALIRGRTSIERRNLEGQELPYYLLEPPSSWRTLLTTERDRVRVVATGSSTCARP